ncbi:MAG: tetratricopeptide repeat protein [Spirochaetota bacterium]|nr:MAG: tetratricopeptide repeat protein [Spirochaetota bacterium]
MHIKWWYIFLCVFLVIGAYSCSDHAEKRALARGKKVLSQRDKEIDDLEEVRGELRKVIERKITAVGLLESTLRLLGRKYIELGSYRLAEGAFIEAEQLVPYNAFIKKDLGECYYFLALSAVESEEKEEYIELSRAYYRKALDIDPDLIEARYGYGLLLFFGYGDPTGAIDEMKFILDHDPKHVAAHFALGRFYYETGELGKALNEYISLTRILPHSSPKQSKVEENINKINRELGVNE